MWINPVFFRLSIESDKLSYDVLIKEHNPQIFDTIDSQLLELVHCQNPSISKEEVVKQNLVEEKIISSGHDKFSYGVWVYYPWKNQLIHTLDEEEFIELRTNRNKYKITHEEQELLRSKKVGIVGLSVGRAVATTLALERIAGEIRLADFDELELSNLNRIKAPLSQLGVNKTISAAHEILEIDPFIKVKCYTDGLTDDNMESFFTDDGKIDLLVEECDDIAMKIKARLLAKKLQTPVVMETNDNNIIDVERFDLEPNREIFHGRISHLDLDFIHESKSLDQILKALFFKNELSKRMISSMSRIGTEITMWPQIASETFAGAGKLIRVSRDILCQKTVNSGRRIGREEH